MPILDDAKDMVILLAEKFGWGISIDRVATKIYYAMIELGEAGGAWKHRDDKEWLLNELDIKTDQELINHVVEEFIDVIFYCLNGIHCLDPHRNVDQEFDRKWKINLERGRTYIDDHE